MIVQKRCRRDFACVRLSPGERVFKNPYVAFKVNYPYLTAFILVLVPEQLWECGHSYDASVVDKRSQLLRVVLVTEQDHIVPAFRQFVQNLLNLLLHIFGICWLEPRGFHRTHESLDIV